MDSVIIVIATIVICLLLSAGLYYCIYGNDIIVERSGYNPFANGHDGYERL